MLELVICWLFGHLPAENEVELKLENLPGSVVTLCKRCDKMITYDPKQGWVKW